MNTFKSTLLLVAMTLLLLFFGEHFGGQNGMAIALAVAVAMNFTTYFSPTRSRSRCIARSR